MREHLVLCRGDEDRARAGEGAGRPLITSWHRTEADGAEAGDAVNTARAVVVPPNGACWLDASAGGTDGGDPR